MHPSLLILLVFLPMQALAQGFAGLGSDAEGYALPVPGHVLEFPRDLGPHPAFRIEWWYLTANLRDTAGGEYGAQFTLFRQASAPPPEREGWDNRQFWLGHAALTTGSAHYFDEKIARGGSGQAGATAWPFAAWIDDWRFAAEPPAPGLGRVRLQARGAAFAYDLTLTTGAEIVRQGQAGYSVKSDQGQASYYISQPYFTVSGRITVEGREIEVTGSAWMDKEWSSQPLAEDQSGWDWFSLHLGPTTRLMLFRLRHDDGRHYVSGNWIEGTESTPLTPGEVSLSVLGTDLAAGRDVPTRWRIEIPTRGVDLETEPLFAGAWNGTGIGYWEGPIRAHGSHRAQGYLELTGY